MPRDDLCLRSLSDVAQLIERQEVSPVEVTEAILARIDRLNPQLNAFITVTADDAMRSARAAESEIQRGNYRGPLHGIPISLKDLLQTAGVRTTAASRILADYVPDRDAAVVTKLRAAGAVLLGKTNLLEFAYGEVHPDYGPARNPWHTDFGTSGSSSGSGAAVAAGLGFASIGSDTGGSIRFPAAYCGIVGLKPTYGLVSRSGVLPLAWSLDHVGPMTRTVRDCAVLLDAIAGYDPHDPTAARTPTARYVDAVDTTPEYFTIGVGKPEPGDGVMPDVRAATDAAVEAIRALGFEVKSVDLPYADKASRTALAMLYVEASAYHMPWLRTRAGDYGANTRERLELGALLPAMVYVQASRARRLIADAYRTLLQEVDVILTPTSPFAAYRIDEPWPDPVSQAGDRMGPLIRFTAPFNLTGLPAITVPCGFTPEGLPIGVQFAARPFAEETLLRLANAFERAVAAQLPRPTGNEMVT